MQEKKNNKNKVYGKNSIMKIFIIILFFILIILLSTTVCIDIEKLEIYNGKTVFKIKLKIYIFKYIKIFQKKIHKKDIIKMIENMSKENIIKDEKIIRKIKYTFSDMNINVEYGIRNVLLNTYTYGIINMIIPIFLAQKGTNNIEYNITTNFRKKFISIQARGKIQVQILENIIKLFKQNVVKLNKKKICFRQKNCTSIKFNMQFVNLSGYFQHTLMQ